MHVKNLVYTEVTGTPYASTVNEITVQDASVFSDPASVGNYDVTLYNLRKNPGKAFNDGEAAIPLLTGIDTGTNTLTFSDEIGIALSDSIDWAVIQGATVSTFDDKADLSGGNTFSGDQDISGQVRLGNLSFPIRLNSTGSTGIMEINSATVFVFRSANASGRLDFQTAGTNVAMSLGSSQQVDFKGILTAEQGLISSKGITQEPLSSDPADPANGDYVVWVSDGTGSGDDGDVMFKITDSGGTTKIGTLIDYSAV